MTQPHDSSDATMRPDPLPPELDYLRAPSDPQQLTPAQSFLHRVKELVRQERARHLRHLSHLGGDSLQMTACVSLMADLHEQLHAKRLLLSPVEHKLFRDAKAVSVRSLLMLLDAHAKEALGHALKAVTRLAEMKAVRYGKWERNQPHPLDGQDLHQSFQELSRHHVINKDYLVWAMKANQLKRIQQRRLRDLLAEDARLQWECNHGEDAAQALWGQSAEDLSSAEQTHETELVRLRKESPKLAELIDSRPFGAAMRPRVMLDSGGVPWTAFAPWAREGCRYNSSPWPFPGTTAGKQGRLMARDGWLREARIRLDLGSLLRFPENRWFASEVYTGDEDIPPTAAEAAALDEWLKLTDAGLVLRIVGATLYELATVFENGQGTQGKADANRCAVCWRRQQPGKTLYCHLHKPHADVRADADRLQVWSERREVQWRNTLAVLLGSQPALIEVVEQVTNAWQVFPLYRPDERLASAPSQGELGALLKALEPLTHGMVQERLRKTIADLPNPGHGGAVASAWAFHPVEFFGDYFCASSRPGIGPDVDRDPQHPLGLIQRARKERPFDHYLARDLMRDLLAQRVWLELGGAAVDLEIADRDRKAETTETGNTFRKHPRIPTARPDQGRINPIEAQEMKRAGSTHAEIARRFKVTPSAVTQFFNKRKDKGEP